VMSAGCATGELAWARELVDPMWTRFLRSQVHGSAHLALTAHALHAQLVLNEYVAQPGKHKPGALIRDDLRAIERSPFKVAACVRQRLEGRVAWLEKRRNDAAALFRASAAGFEAVSSRDEALRDRYACGIATGGAAGSELSSAAENGLRELGVVNPPRELRGFFPEMFS
jgi:hypothetical protein